VATDLIVPDWPAPARVHALVSTRALGDMGSERGRLRLRAHLPADPAWLKQVHGATAVDAARAFAGTAADACFSSERNVVCAVTIADCMPVLLADDAGEVIGIAHAGWRGLAAGVIEATIDVMRLPGERVLAWLGPAIGSAVYEVGEEVRAAFLDRDRGAAAAFAPARAGHWRLDLYAIARRRLAARGVKRIYGGGFCTFSEAERFFSYRRDGTASRMAAAVWLA